MTDVPQRLRTLSPKAAVVALTPGKPDKCENCGERETVRTVEGVKKGKLGIPVAVWLCSACAGRAPDSPLEGSPEKLAQVPQRPRRKTRNRRATTDFHEQVEEILYRQAGATASQVARWLLLMTDDFDARPYPERSALEAAYRTLQAMREAGVAEAIAIRRKWLGKKSGVAGSGRREGFFRFKKNGDGVVEGAVLADVDGIAAKKGYARPWFGGAIEHAAHRGDLMLLFAEEASAAGVDLDPFSCYGETHPGYPLYGYEKPRVDAAGEEKPSRENAQHKYETVVPDGEFVAIFGDAEGLPDGDGQDDGHREYPRHDGTYEDSYRDTYEDTYEERETGEEVFA